MIDLVLIDMDGVLADFARHALAKFDRLDVYDNWPSGKYEIDEIIGIPQDELWAELDKEGPEFWSSLPELPWATELCDLVRKKVAISIFLRRLAGLPHPAWVKYTGYRISLTRVFVGICWAATST